MKNSHMCLWPGKASSSWRNVREEGRAGLSWSFLGNRPFPDEMEERDREKSRAFW